MPFISVPPGTAFVPLLRDMLLKAIQDNKRTRVILPAGDVCRLAREAVDQHSRILIYSLDEAANFFGKHAPLHGLKNLSPACGRFLVNAFLEKAGAAAGEKAAPRFYRLLSEAERLFGDPAKLADDAEISGFHEQCSDGARLFLMLCRHWQAVVKEAGYISPSAKRSSRIDYWLNETPPNPERERLVAAYMPVADDAVQTLCRFIADTDDGIIFMQGGALNDFPEANTLAPDHPDHYFGLARTMIEQADNIYQSSEPHDTAMRWFAPAAALPALLSNKQHHHIPLPEARIYADTLIEQEANTQRLIEAAQKNITAALVTQDTQAAAATAALLNAHHIPFVSVFEKTSEQQRYEACLDACFAYAAPHFNSPTGALMQLLRAPFSDIEEEHRHRTITLTRAIIISTGQEAGAETINDIPSLLRSPAWPADATDETALLNRLHEAMQLLKETAKGTGSPAFSWHKAFIAALALFNLPEREEESRLPSIEDATGFLNADGLGALSLTAERALSLLKEASAACFPTCDTALLPGVPLICRAEHVRLLEPDLLIFSGLTEDGFDRSDTDAYLGKLPESAALLSAEARIARRSAELLAGLSAGYTVYTCARSRAGAVLRPSRAMSRLLLLHKAEQTEYPAYIPETQRCDADTAPQAMPCSALRAETLHTPFHATALETAFINPYIFYAKHMLRLYEPRHNDDDKPHAEFGSFVHDAADFYHRQRDHGYNDPYLFKRCLHQAAQNRRMRLGKATVRAFIAAGAAREDAFLHDSERCYADYPLVSTEVSHRIDIPLENGARLIIKARLDRCAGNHDATRLLITDIKTGTPPSKKDMTDGRKAQLPLQALTTLTAFPDAQRTLRAVTYRPDGAYTEIILPEDDCAEIMAVAKEALHCAATHFFLNETTQFPFTRTTDYGDVYHHLARHDGWRYADTSISS